jgi:S-adenosylmethionine decarboxylase
MNYQPGLHLIAEITCSDVELLKDFHAVKRLYDLKIEEYGLQKIGEVYHNFPNGGFTGVVCLTESHIALHTWPEFGLFTFDVYLSNFTRNNDATTRAIFEDTLAFFGSDTYTKREIQR